MSIFVCRELHCFSIQFFGFRLKHQFASEDMSKLKAGRVYYRNSGMKGLNEQHYIKLHLFRLLPFSSIIFLFCLLQPHLLKHSLQLPPSKTKQENASLRNRPEVTLRNRPRGYKTFFMLNSTEHEISLGNKNKNTKN